MYVTSESLSFKHRSQKSMFMRVKIDFSEGVVSLRRVAEGGVNMASGTPTA